MSDKKNYPKRNKNGKTKDGLPYRYGKAKKSCTLRRDNLDLSVLTDNEFALLKFLNKQVMENSRKVYRKATIEEIQDQIFPASSYKNYGTSDTRNLLRRIGPQGAGLLERVERGTYRLSEKGRKHMAKVKGKKPAAKAETTTKKVTAKKKASSKKTASKKKASSKKVTAKKTKKVDTSATEAA